MMRALLVLAALAATPAAADTVLAARTLRPGMVIGPADLRLAPGDTPGAATDPAALIGREARTILYAGRPVALADTAPPALVERNGRVVLRYRAGPLRITAEGRALGRAAAGEAITALNVDSRTTVAGIVAPDGSVVVRDDTPPGN